MERFHTLPGRRDLEFLMVSKTLVTRSWLRGLFVSITLNLSHPRHLRDIIILLISGSMIKGPWPSLEKTLDKTRSMLLDATGEQKEILEKLEENLSKKSEIN
jgi:hypothetical protein